MLRGSQAQAIESLRAELEAIAPEKFVSHALESVAESRMVRKCSVFRPQMLVWSFEASPWAVQFEGIGAKKGDAYSGSVQGADRNR